MIMGCGIVTGLIAARSLGPDGRGQLAAITVWTITFVYVGDFGLPDAAAYAAAAERDRRDRVWTTAQILAIAFGLVIVLVGWWFVPFAFTGDNEALIPLARWYLALFAVPSLGASVALAWLQGVGRMRAFNLSRPIVQLVNAAGMAILFLEGVDSLEHFAAVLLVGTASGWLVAAALGPGRRAIAAPPSAPLARRMLGYGVRTQWGNWATVANERLDQLLLSTLTPAASLGLYVVAFSYAMLLQAIANTTAMAMWPGLVAAHQAGTAPAYIARWYRRLLWVTLTAAVIVAGASPFVIPLLFGEAFSSAVPLALLLVPAVTVLGMNEILSTGFHGSGRPEVVSVSQAVGLVVTVAALAALLPRYGAYGAAVASLLSYSSTHVFLLRQTIGTFGVDMRSLVVPTHDDRDALLAAGSALAHRFQGSRRPAGLNS
ncbi:MAG: hypothetical protein A3F70_03715 [Acidobacteria bacterium RIFCSPLOWO2_12_FULL_67_14]|nr:MAG: hypothetical protein A3F70_03715 [Acidobacteria bacterium RIFCSPLOWO2_12_FULL_67_14]